jgi:DNA-binding NtrC family response regulator
MKMGALDYLPKPFTPDELRAIVRQALAERDIQRQNQKTEQQIRKKAHRPQTYRQQPENQTGDLHGGKVAPTDSTVLVYMGKAEPARNWWPGPCMPTAGGAKRCFLPWTAVRCRATCWKANCSAMKGAFTGADKDKEGIFKLAMKEPFFLMKSAISAWRFKANCLRFLETREFLPLGARKPLQG